MKGKTGEVDFGPTVKAYTRAHDLEEGVLIDVSATAKEVGINTATAITRSVLDDYVTVPEPFRGRFNDQARLRSILSAFRAAVRAGKLTRNGGTFAVTTVKPEVATWSANEKPVAGSSVVRSARLSAVCGVGDDGTPALTILRPDEG